MEIENKIELNKNVLFSDQMTITEWMDDLIKIYHKDLS